MAKKINTPLSILMMAMETPKKLSKNSLALFQVCYRTLEKQWDISAINNKIVIIGHSSPNPLSLCLVVNERLLKRETQTKANKIQLP